MREIFRQLSPRLHALTACSVNLKSGRTVAERRVASPTNFLGKMNSVTRRYRLRTDPSKISQSVAMLLLPTDRRGRMDHLGHVTR